MPIEASHNLITSQLLKLFLPLPFPTRTHLHLLPSLPLFLHQRQPRHYRRPNQLHDRRASDPPYLYTHASRRRPWESKQPLHVPRHPASRYPEERPFGEPELQEEAEAVGAQPAESGDGAVKGRFEGLEFVRYGSVSISQAVQSTIFKLFAPLSLCLGDLTLLIILRQVLIVAPPQLRPLCKLVLRTRGVHLPLEAYHLLLELGLSLGIGRRRRGKPVVEVP